MDALTMVLEYVDDLFYQLGLSASTVPQYSGRVELEWKAFRIGDRTVWVGGPLNPCRVALSS
jgi:hypothetical protein